LYELWSSSRKSWVGGEISVEDLIRIVSNLVLYYVENSRASEEQHRILGFERRKKKNRKGKVLAEEIT